MSYWNWLPREIQFEIIDYKECQERIDLGQHKKMFTPVLKQLYNETLLLFLELLHYTRIRDWAQNDLKDKGIIRHYHIWSKDRNYPWRIGTSVTFR